MEGKMKKSIYFRTISSGLATVFVISIVLTSLAFAGNDPSIKGDLRRNIKASMMSFIENRMVNDTFMIYDASKGKLLRLKFDKLHDGIVKKGEFYISCADFFDDKGKKVDLDFLVIPDGDNLHTVQAVIHAMDGKKRKYHLES
jgi:hypothetical protein